MRLPVSCAYCNYGAEKNPDAGVKLNRDDEIYSQDFAKIVSCINHLTKNSIS